MKRYTCFGPIWLLILSSLLLILATPLVAQDTAGADTGGEKRVRLAASMGIQSWGTLADLRPVAGGSFRSSGLGLGGSAHWMMRAGERADLLFGVDLYAFTNESNVFHISNDVQFRALQLTPSIRFSFDSGNGPRYLFGIGLGYYEADITELNTYWWGLQSETELWNDQVLGGYVGLDIDFPRRKRDTGNGFFMSARIHGVDFGTIRDERFTGPGLPTLGPDAGNLSGPLTVVHFGYQWSQ